MERFSRRQRFRTRDVEIGLRGETPLEGPQTLLRFGESAYAREGVRILRRLYQEPAHARDGHVVLETDRPPTDRVISDTLVQPLTDYYYRAFGWLNGEYVPIPNGITWAFSGARPALEPSGLETVLFQGISSGKAGAVTFNATPLSIGTTLIAVPVLHGIRAGTWLRIGDASPVDVLVLAAEDAGPPYYLTIAPLEDVPPSVVRRPVLYQTLTFRVSDPGYAGRSTLVRQSGSWLADGFAQAIDVKIVGSGYNDGRFVVQWAVEESDARTLVFQPGSFVTDDVSYGRAQVYLPFGKLPGERVQVLRRQGTELQRYWYNRLVPDGVRADDVEVAAQGRELVLSKLPNGEQANLGEPGLQYGYERWVRWLCADLDRCRAAILALPALYDPQRAPAEYLRDFARRYGAPVPEHDAQRLRAWTEMQPALMSARGRRDLLRTWITSLTGQRVRVRHGRDRVVRFNDRQPGFTRSGLARSGLGFPTEITSDLLEDNTKPFPPKALIGQWLQWDANDPLSIAQITDNTDQTLSAPSAGSPILVEGTSDDQLPTHEVAIGLTLIGAGTSGSGFHEIVWDGQDWEAHGYAVDQWVVVLGVSGIQKVYQIQAFEDDRLITTSTGSGFTPGTYAEGWVQGGIAGRIFADEDIPTLFDSGQLTTAQAVLFPNIADGGGPDGGPRGFRILSNVRTPGKSATVLLVDGDMTGVASPGDSYRICTPYRIVTQNGGARDIRTSFYTDNPHSAFNERGLFIYLAERIRTEDVADVRQFVSDWRRACLTVLLYAQDTLILEEH
jgi:hypothetical protein